MRTAEELGDEFLEWRLEIYNEGDPLGTIFVPFDHSLSEVIFQLKQYEGFCMQDINFYKQDYEMGYFLLE